MVFVLLTLLCTDSAQYLSYWLRMLASEKWEAWILPFLNNLVEFLTMTKKFSRNDVLLSAFDLVVPF